jgi:hypothetical protein
VVTPLPVHHVDHRLVLAEHTHSDPIDEATNLMRAHSHPANPLDEAHHAPKLEALKTTGGP